ncbi:MAG: T9SS type B sorting domain-containing protein [Flavobacteriaceae bacterium]
MLLVVAIFSQTISGQTVSVNTTGNTPTQLVDMLMAGSCSVRSNINISSPQSVGYFNGNSSSFPISEGIIIRSGNAANTQGPYTGQDLSSNVSTSSDPDLQEISNNSGQISTITDVAFLEFDFVPNGTQFSFNFLFASNEYGEWQCGFSDVFAFLLTDLTTGETINLAVVPGTTTPISVKDIRDNANNLSCNSVNEELFSTYNVNNPGASTINMRGHTVVMNASAIVNPTRLYKIRLVIGDYNDSDFDSAVFIESGSFNTYIDIGDDQTICGNQEVTLDTQITDTTNYSFEWRRDGTTISGENNPTLTTSVLGTYNVYVTTSNGCVLTDEAIISELQVSAPVDIYECENGVNTSFDLTANDATVLNIDPALYEIFYYSSLDNANNNIPIPTNQTTNFLSSGNQTIYIRVRNITTNDFCSPLLDFDLSVLQLSATDPNDLTFCEDSPIIDLPGNVGAEILNTLDPLSHSIRYFTSLDDANANTNEITNPSSFPNPTTDITIWARLFSTINENCFDIVDFTISISQLPLVDDLDPVLECSSYTLPALTNGMYFTESGGQGTQLNPGDVIDESIRVYIYNENSDSCNNESSFTISIIQDYDIELEYCEIFIVPSVSFGDFYTETGGPSGSGSLLAAGSEITTSQTVFFYSEFEGVFCTEKTFNIEVFPLPQVDELDNVITCTPYSLPNLTNGNYFSEPNGAGVALYPGYVVNNSRVIYIFSDDGRCTNETDFRVDIINTADFTDLTVCGNYTIPSTQVGGYFTESAGGGDPLPAGSLVSTSSRIYYFAEITEGINCTIDLPIEVTVHPIPLVDSPEDVIRCINDPYTLPPLTNGNYFTLPGGGGTPLFAGDIITESQIIYTFSDNGFCTNGRFFSVEIRPFPLIDNFTDIFVCDPYTLPELNNGLYFTESNGQGTQLNAGDIISTTQTIYIFNQDPDIDTCSSENVFTVNILGVTADELEDVGRCGSYTLPELSVGNYFTEPNGLGTQLNAGDLITSSQTVYIYAENGDRFFCFDNSSFDVTITNLPASRNFENQESCGSFTLETISDPTVVTSYYRQPNGVNLIDPADYTLTQPGIYTIHARTADIDNLGCYIDEVFSVTVYPLQELIIEDVIICIDPITGNTTQTATLESGLDASAYTVNWYLNGTLVGTGINYEALEVGTYTVETIKLTPDVGNDCNYTPTEVEVKASSPDAKITFLTDPFDPLTNVKVDFIDIGLGSYEYQLDNGPFQVSNIFLNIGYGQHIITVRDTSGLCGDITLPFTAISHPVFFTPNGDGINDTWNIPDLRNDTNAVIKIYDRFGRFIKQIKPSETGWDGFSNNGSASPSTSYWFEVEFTFEGSLKKHISYFALERK